MNPTAIRAACAQLEGRKYGRLTYLGKAPRDKSGHWCWRLQCDCGKIVVIAACDVNRGHTVSCGCYQRESMSARTTTHGHARPKKHTKEYRIWAGIRSRCANHPDYSGRGIKMCDRWKESFLNFLEDMGKCPDGMSIDRKDNDGDYNPSNCRWATPVEQSLNRRSNIFITINGETKTASQWCDLNGLKRTVAYDRIKYGWDPVLAVTTPKSK